MGSVFWFNNPSVLWTGDAWCRVVPTADMALAEKFNALLRASAWFALIVALLWRDLRVLVIVPLVAAIEVFAFSDMRRKADDIERFLDESGMDLRDAKLCVKPTQDNPFMNVLISDYANRPARPAACKLRGDTAAAAEALFSKDVLAQEDDLFERVTSSRQFYATPATTIPNDQEGFIKFLYGGMANNCKAGGSDRCFQNQTFDVRQTTLL